MRPYKMKSGSSTEVRAYSVILKILTCTDMAPCSSNYSSVQHIRISEKDNIKVSAGGDLNAFASACTVRMINCLLFES